MNDIGKKAKVYYVTTLAVTWSLWIISMLIAVSRSVSIPYNEGFYSIVTKGFASSDQAILYIVFSLAVYGPALGALVSRSLNKKAQLSAVPRQGNKGFGCPENGYVS